MRRIKKLFAISSIIIPFIGVSFKTETCDKWDNFFNQEEIKFNVENNEINYKKLPIVDVDNVSTDVFVEFINLNENSDVKIFNSLIKEKIKNEFYGIKKIECFNSLPLIFIDFENTTTRDIFINEIKQWKFLKMIFTVNNDDIEIKSTGSTINLENNFWSWYYPTLESENQIRNWKKYNGKLEEHISPFMKQFKFLNLEDYFNNKDIYTNDLKYKLDQIHDPISNVGIVEVSYYNGKYKNISKNRFSKIKNLNVFQNNDPNLNWITESLDNLNQIDVEETKLALEHQFSSHATLVSLIMSSPFGVNKYAKTYYSFINPDTQKNLFKSLMDSYDKLCKKDVKVINNSFDFIIKQNRQLYLLDKINDLIEKKSNEGVLFVFAVGNLREDLNNGKWNAIQEERNLIKNKNVLTVAAADIDIYQNKWKPANYSIWYENAGINVERPHIIAPGTFISSDSIVYDENIIIPDYGTSFSAPSIAGLISLWLRRKEAKKISGMPGIYMVPLSKAVLAASSSQKNNSFLSKETKKKNGLYNRSGVGMPDFKKMIEITKNINFFDAPIEEEHEKELRRTKRILLLPNQKIRVALSSTMKSQLRKVTKLVEEYKPPVYGLKLVDTQSREILAETDLEHSSSIKILEYVNTTNKAITVNFKIKTKLDNSNKYINQTTNKIVTAHYVENI
ncbi:S8 family serine peptidase [Mycoplasmopsis gallinarum]|uniref:S8 family serine peptidase n=1 Tax=Mycoplasmopsis gallinarum TaxID=29557 RepID=UPI0004898AB9|nr:S8 family serine peptidase [Mycoplasmopsis gallinarum]